MRPSNRAAGSVIAVSLMAGLEPLVCATLRAVVADFEKLAEVDAIYAKV